MSAGILGAASKDPILRFFKILQNEEYSQILYLPPPFARNVEHLVDQETYLENSRGQRWAVKISKVDGSLAFCRGWKEFFRQQSLMVGHFLEFHYFRDSHFLVIVYGRSGCERINFNRGLKIARIDDKIAAEYKPIQKFDAVPNSKLEKRVHKKPRESCGEAAREDKEIPNILTQEKECHIIQKVGSGKSSSVPTITPVESEANEVLVDVPILCAENHNWGDLSNLCSIKAFANLDDMMPQVVSGFQRGEGRKALLPDAAKNAETRTREQYKDISIIDLEDVSRSPADENFPSSEILVDGEKKANLRKDQEDGVPQL